MSSLLATSLESHLPPTTGASLWSSIFPSTIISPAMSGLEAAAVSMTPSKMLSPKALMFKPRFRTPISLILLGLMSSMALISLATTSARRATPIRERTLHSMAWPTPGAVSPWRPLPARMHSLPLVAWASLGTTSARRAPQDEMHS